MNTYIPIDYLEEVACELEITVDYLINEFLIDGALELYFPPYKLTDNG